MERPLGPRAQPDKRSAAYESIFGRPTATHHQPSPPLPANPYYYQGNGQAYTQQPAYGAQLDRRTSHTSMRAPSINNYAHQQSFRQPAYNYYQGYQNTLAPPQVPGRARSIGAAAGTIHPTPEEPPDPGLEALQQTGLTPAQAYQAQVYMNSPMHQQQTPQSQYAPSSSSTPDRSTFPSQSDLALPQLGLNIDTNGGKLDLDFGESLLGDDRQQGPSQGTQHHYPSGSQPPSVRSRLSGASNFGPIIEGIGSSYSSPTRSNPPQLDTTSNPQSNSALSISPVSSTLIDSTSSAATSTLSGGRRSSESSRTLPGSQPFRRDRGVQDRSRSMSATISPQYRAMLENSVRATASRPPVPSIPHRESPRPSHSRRAPVVYPALISRVAQAFKDRILLNDHVKDGLTYHHAFDGREAVDTIAYIIKTTDRSLALLYGRSLDAQKFFHAVTYDHRLRDSNSDLYQFRTKVPSPFVSGEIASPTADEDLTNKESPTPSAESGSDNKDGISRPSSPSPPDSVKAPAVDHRRDESLSDDIPIPTGVFTILTDCYSPTCTRDQLCYSVICPRRLEQQARLNMKPQPALKKEISRESLGEIVVCFGICVQFI